MFRRLSVFLVSVSFLCQTNPLQSYFLRRSSGSVANFSSYRFPLAIAYKQINSLSPLNTYPLLHNGNSYDSKQVSNTLWNLLSIARFILCTSTSFK